MSGYKRATVSISQEEYDRLRQAESKLRSLPDQSQEALERILRKSSQSAEQNLRQIRQRQGAFEQFASGLDQSIRDLETSTSRAILACEQQAATNVQQYAGCLWDHFDEALQAHAHYFETSITANQAANQQEIANINRAMRQQALDQVEKRQLAEKWVDAARGMAAFIEENYAHEQFLPGTIARLESQLAQTEENLAIGLSEASISNAQQLYRAFSDARVDLERLQNEWSVMLQAAQEACRQTLLYVEGSQIVPGVDLDGNLLDYAIDVGYWSQGRINQLLEDLLWIQARLEPSEEWIDTATLEHYLTKDLPAAFQTLEEIVLDARINALNSQLRINIADLVVRALQEQGFQLAAADYESADLRSAYDAHLTNLEGNEVIVQVAPTGSDLGENELHMQSLDREERTEHELHQRWIEVSHSLADYGVAVGQYIREDMPVVQADRANRRPSQGRAMPARLRAHQSTRPAGIH